MAFIIDRYNKYNGWDREHQVQVFEVNGQWYAIFEVEMEWGLPKLDIRIEQEKDATQYFVYDTKEQAMEFVRAIRRLN